MRYGTRIKRWGFRIFVTLFALAAAGYWAFLLLMPPILRLDMKRIEKERDSREHIKSVEEQLPGNGEVALAMRAYLDSLQAFLPPGKYHPNSPFASVKKVSRGDSVEYRGEFYNDFSILLHHDMTLRRLIMYEYVPYVGEEKNIHHDPFISRNEAMEIMNSILETIGSEVKVEHPDEIQKTEPKGNWKIYKFIHRHGIRCADNPVSVYINGNSGNLESLAYNKLTYTPEYKEPVISSNRAVRIAFGATHARLYAWWARFTGADMEALLNPPELVFMNEELISAMRLYSWAKHTSKVPPGNRLCWEVKFSYFPFMGCPNHACWVIIDSQTGEVIGIHEAPKHD